MRGLKFKNEQVLSGLSRFSRFVGSLTCQKRRVSGFSGPYENCERLPVLQ